MFIPGDGAAFSAWDFAAGQLVVEEIGGRCSDHSGAPLCLTHRDTVCSTGGVHGEVIEAMMAISEKNEKIYISHQKK